MTIDTDDLLNSIIASFSRISYIEPNDIPNIDLYMDQVTTFLDERLKSSSRDKSDEKLMTKTMINNYAKNGVIPPPVRKKYNKEHILILTMIYYFKSILQINDIKELLDPIADKFFGKDGQYGIEDVYLEIFENKDKQIKALTEDVIRELEKSQETFKDAPEENKEYLQMFSFVCMLGCDVFVKKLLIEKIVDSLRENRKKYDVKLTKETLKRDKETKREKDSKRDKDIRLDKDSIIEADKYSSTDDEKHDTQE